MQFVNYLFNLINLMAEEQLRESKSIPVRYITGVIKQHDKWAIASED